MVNEQIKVLLIEDNPGDVRLVQKALNGKRRKTFSLEHVDRLSTGLECLSKKEIDVVLLDLSLPDSQGINTFFRVHNRAPEVPTVVISGFDDEMLATKTVHEGAQDFIVKRQIDSNLLVRSIRYAIARQRLMGELRSMSIIDKLTGLYNRRGLLTLAERQLNIVNRTKRGLFVIFADLDNMKGINDTLGHNVGDQALREMSIILKKTFRKSDIIARVGGDEFVVVAIEAQKDSAEVFRARIQENIRIHNTRSNHPYQLSISVGIACYDAECPSSFDELLVRADRLMYEQKRRKKILHKSSKF